MMKIVFCSPKWNADMLAFVRQILWSMYPDATFEHITGIRRYVPEVLPDFLIVFSRAMEDRVREFARSNPTVRVAMYARDRPPGDNPCRSAVWIPGEPLVLDEYFGIKAEEIREIFKLE